MALIKLSLESLRDLDEGKPALIFDRQLENAVQDCLNRPTDDRPRKVTMELLLEPVAEETDVPGNFNCTGIHCQFKTRCKSPDRQSKTYSFGVNKKGQLYFSEASPLNVNQTTFDEVGPDQKVVRAVPE